MGEWNKQAGLAQLHARPSAINQNPLQTKNQQKLKIASKKITKKKCYMKLTELLEIKCTTKGIN